jgi:hypothetical protein
MKQGLRTTAHFGDAERWPPDDRCHVFDIRLERQAGQDSVHALRKVLKVARALGFRCTEVRQVTE